MSAPADKLELRPIPVGRSYRAVIADPPWRFDLRSAQGEQKSAQAQYRCMGFAELVAFAREIQLDFLCAPDCALVMWATFPMLPEAIDLMARWGFAYKTGGAWGKLTVSGKLGFGTGYVLRSAAELWLVGARGSIAPEVHDERNLILAETRGHSRKPDALYGIVERMWPGGRYLELFARQRRAGWDAYGDALGGFVGAGDEIAAGAERAA
jgi:N6-adenosine-specific RNA methylase IME4